MLRTLNLHFYRVEFDFLSSLRDFGQFVRHIDPLCARFENLFACRK